MERFVLTRCGDYQLNCKLCPHATTPNECSYEDCLDEVNRRLYAYEDIGLEPWEIVDNFEMGPVCAGCDGKTKEGFRTDLCTYPNNIEKCFQREKHLVSLLKAEQEGRLLVLPCKVGTKIRDKNADYVFTIQQVETCTVYGKDAILFRCGNPGTEDYTAFYDFEIGDNIEILSEE